MRRRIRPVYSTVVNYAAAIFRAFSGIVFYIILGRGLSIAEFAAFGVIQAFAEAASTLARVWGTWAQRALARIPGTPREAERAAAGTDLALTGVYAAILIPVYVAFASAESRLLGVGLPAFMTGYAFVVARLFEDVGYRLAGVTRPYAHGYARFAGEAARFPLAVVLVYIWDMGLPGALAAVTAGSLASTMVLAVVLVRAGVVFTVVDWGQAALWLKSWTASFLLLSPGLARSAARPYLSVFPSGKEAVSGLNAVLAGETAILRGAHAVHPVVYAHAAERPGAGELRREFFLYIAMASLPVSAYLAIPVALTSIVAPEYSFAARAASVYAVATLLFGLAILYRGVLFAFDPPGPPRGSAIRYMGVRASVLQAIAVLVPYAAVGAAATLGAGPKTLLEALAVTYAFSAAIVVLALHRWAHRLVGGSLLAGREVVAVIASVAAAVTVTRLLVGDFVVYSVTDSLPRLAQASLALAVPYLLVLAVLSPEARSIVSSVLAKAGIRRAGRGAPGA